MILGKYSFFNKKIAKVSQGDFKYAILKY